MSDVLVELGDRVAEAVEHAVIATTRHDVDVANLLWFCWIVGFLRYDPETVGKQ